MGLNLCFYTLYLYCGPVCVMPAGSIELRRFNPRLGSVSRSAQAGPGSLQVRQRPGGGGRPAEREVLHPAAGGHRDLLVHVAVHPRPQVQAVGLGGGAGETPLGRASIVSTLSQFGFLFASSCATTRGGFSTKVSGEKWFVGENDH